MKRSSWKCDISFRVRLCSDDRDRYVVSQRSAGIDLICCEKNKPKQRNEVTATGISPEITELDKGLYDLLE